MRGVSPTWAIAFEVVGLIAMLWYRAVAALPSSRNSGAVDWWALFGVFVISLPGIVASAILHYRCWQAVPRDIARTTPGKAVGFAFIPFFNFYWHFVSLVGLAEDSARALGTKTRGRELGIALAILSISAWTGLGSGVLAFPFLIASFIVWLLYVLRMVDNANALIAARRAESAAPAAMAGHGPAVPRTLHG